MRKPARHFGLSYYYNKRAKRTQIFQKPTSYLNTVGARKVARSKLHTKNPQILGMTTLSLVTQVQQVRGWS
jgi:hypothetical protein